MIRRGCSTSWLAVRPLAQKSCQVWGFSLSAEILMTRLFSTVTSTPHEARQYRQKVCTVRVLMGSSCPTCSAAGAVKRIAYSLGLGHRPIFTAAGGQFRIATALDDLARFHHQDDVRIADRRKPMRDNEARSITTQVAHCVLDQQL